MMNPVGNSTMIIIESWFIPLDILMIITTILSAILGLIFLLIVVINKTCWSVPILLTSNSCLVELLLSFVLLSTAIFIFQHDLTKNTENISICIIIGFLFYIVVPMQNYSYLLLAMYRYRSIVYPAQIWWQSTKFQLCLILGKWLFCILFALPLLLTGQIVYNSNNQICQVPLGFTLPVIYVGIVLYTMPNVGVSIIYIKLVRYVRQISIRAGQNQTLFRARRELRLVQRTFILASTLITLGLPYMSFTWTSFFTTLPKYYARIALIFIDISVLSIMIMLYCFTQPVSEKIRNLLPKSNAVEPIILTVKTRY